MKGKTHDLYHDLTFNARTNNCGCHSIRSMFRVLGVYNFEEDEENAQRQTRMYALEAISAIIFHF